MLDRFLVYQRSWILIGTLGVFALTAWSHVSGFSSAWLDGLTILLGLGFSIYNALFAVNWHHVHDRLVREVQTFRARRNFPTLPSKEVWFREKVVSLIGMLVGILMALSGIFAMLGSQL